MGSLLLGHDSRFSYRKICIATQYLSRRDGEGRPLVEFYVSNMDHHDVLLDNSGGAEGDAPQRMRYMPATGALAASIIAASGRPPDHVCGKPSGALHELIMEEYVRAAAGGAAAGGADGADGGRRRDFLIVGDRVETDIAFGKRCGFTTVLTLTGVSSADSLEAHFAGGDDERALPDYVVPDLCTMVLGEAGGGESDEAVGPMQ